MQTTHPTKQRLLDTGLGMLLEHGYNDLGVQALLEATGTPKGSFYHHFEDKEDFALQVVDQYMTGVHAALDAALSDTVRPPLERVRHFFEMVEQSYKQQGYMGCLLGGLGQELSGVSEVFRRKIAGCFAAIGNRLGTCLEEAEARRRPPSRLGPAAHGEPAGRLLGGRSASQSAARRCRTAEGDARLLLPVRRRSLDGARGSHARATHRGLAEGEELAPRRLDLGERHAFSLERSEGQIEDRGSEPAIRRERSDAVVEFEIDGASDESGTASSV